MWKNQEHLITIFERASVDNADDDDEEGYNLKGLYRVACRVVSFSQKMRRLESYHPNPRP